MQTESEIHIKGWGFQETVIDENAMGDSPRDDDEVDEARFYGYRPSGE